MGNKRTSFKKVNSLAELLGFRLVKHQHLGNRTDYFYNYSLVRDEDGQYKETVLNQTTLKNIYSWLLENN
jgi:hypothetical protein